MRQREKPLVVSQPYEPESDDDDYVSRRGDRNWKPRGRSESPPISSRITRKRTPFERSADDWSTVARPVIKPAHFQHMSDRDYALERARHIQELQEESAERIDEGAGRYEAYLRRTHRRKTGRALPMVGPEAEEIRRLAEESAELADREASGIAAGRNVSRVNLPRDPTVEHELEAREDINPTDAAPPHPDPAAIIRGFFN